MSSTSAIDLLLRYRRTRLPLRLYLPLLVLLLAAGMAAGGSLTAASCAMRALLACGLLVQFRLWDDLSDRDQDRHDHPERVLVCAESLRPFVALLLAAFAGNLVLLVLGGELLRLEVFLVLNAGFLGWYGGLRRLLPSAVLGSLVVLLKYPVFVFLLGGSSWRPGPLLAAAVGVYLGLCVYEVLHNLPGAFPMIATSAREAPGVPALETVPCYYCGEEACSELLLAQDDLTGKPGNFRFVVCHGCGLAYQNPRIPVEHIKAYYDDEYIAHRKKTDWGLLTPFYRRTMEKHDRNKERIVRRFVALGPGSEVLDVGCGAGTFLLRLRRLYGAHITGVDFKDLSSLPGFDEIDFRCGLFYEQDLGGRRFDLITMWHFLEHDYDPLRTLRTAAGLLADTGRLVIEVPRLDSVSYRLFRERWPGLQAPQHTVLYSKKSLLDMVARAGLDVVDYLPYGAFPAYFYLFAGVAFKILKGKGINLGRAIYPYFVGQLLLSPVLLFERRLNLAMQTVVCRRPS